MTKILTYQTIQDFLEDTNTTYKPSATFDVSNAWAIVASNNAALLSREWDIVENKIRDACYDRETTVCCNNLFPETVAELKARGFSVTERRTQFLDDPYAWYRTESAARTIAYFISWDKPEVVQ